MTNIGYLMTNIDYWMTNIGYLMTKNKKNTEGYYVSIRAPQKWRDNETFAEFLKQAPRNTSSNVLLGPPMSVPIGTLLYRTSDQRASLFLS